MFFFLKIKHPLYNPKTPTAFYSTIPSLAPSYLAASPHPTPSHGPMYPSTIPVLTLV